MHPSSLTLMLNLLSPVSFQGASVVDLGSKMQKPNQGTYRKLVEGLGMDYLGVDIEEGPNVDLVWDVYERPSEEDVRAFDFVISGQLLEHLLDPIRAVEAMSLWLKPGGWMLHIAPASQGHHRYPIDCWRVFPDGMEYMLRFCEDVEVGLSKGTDGILDCWGRGRLGHEL